MIIPLKGQRNSENSKICLKVKEIAHIIIHKHLRVTTSPNLFESGKTCIINKKYRHNQYKFESLIEKVCDMCPKSNQIGVCLVRVSMCLVS